MAQWGVRRRVMFINQNQGNEPEHSYGISEEDLKEEDEGAVESESPLMPESTKRRRISTRLIKEMKSSLSVKKRNNKSTTKNRDNNKDRWSAERYKLAEQSMLEILKDEGATFGNPISRPALRLAARKHIGDTGLLDHLLKHIDGKVAPGGMERFRRWFNTNGVMEYWLESADLDNLRKQAGVGDPYWIPPSDGRPGGGPKEDSVSAGELKLLKTELEKLKSEMQELVHRQQEPCGTNHVEELYKQMVKWKADTDQTMKTFFSYWKSVQDMHAELMAWKDNIELQFTEIKSSLSGIQDSKQYMDPSLQSSERWKDWLESTNLDDVQDELIPWFANTNMVNIEPEALVQDPCLMFPLQVKPGDITSQGAASSIGVELLKKEGIDTKSSTNAQDVELKKQNDDQAIVTPDSSTTVNSLSHVHNSSYQEKIIELLNWKAKVDQKLSEISNSINFMSRHQNN